MQHTVNKEKANEITRRNRQRDNTRLPFSEFLVNLIRTYYKHSDLIQIAEQMGFSRTTISIAKNSMKGSPAVANAFYTFYTQIAKQQK